MAVGDDRVWQRPEQLPAWPNMHGGQRRWWVDGVPVPRATMAAGFVLLVVAPLVIWAVATNPSQWLGWTVALVGVLVYYLLVVPWAMRLVDLHRRAALRKGHPDSVEPPVT